jgi:hypothetical protein
VSPINGEDIIFDDDELQDYIDGDLYVLIRSTQYPLGEIRGQIYRVSKYQSSETTQDPTQYFIYCSSYINLY